MKSSGILPEFFFALFMEDLLKFKSEKNARKAGSFFEIKPQKLTSIHYLFDTKSPIFLQFNSEKNARKSR